MNPFVVLSVSTNRVIEEVAILSIKPQHWVMKRAGLMDDEISKTMIDSFRVGFKVLEDYAREHPINYWNPIFPFTKSGLRLTASVFEAMIAWTQFEIDQLIIEEESK